MELDIKAAIEKNLPSAVGEILQKRLVEADATAKKLTDTEAKLEKTQTALNSATKLMVDKETLDKREIGIAAKEKELALKELQLNVRAEVYELHKTYAGQSVAQMERVVLAVFANARLKTSVLENGQVVTYIPGSNGCTGYTNTTPVMTTKTTETEAP